MGFGGTSYKSATSLPSSGTIGQDGVGYGGGGGAASNTFASGAGTSGVIVITEYIS